MGVLEKTQELAVDEKTVSNGAEDAIETTVPYVVSVTLTGIAPLLFHAWNTEAVAEKAGAAKGSKAKKTDNIESYVYRDNDGNLGIPGVCLAAALANSGRYMQDPRSPRKSAMDLVKAGVVPLTIIAPFEPITSKWDFEDARRVVIQRASVTRIRPAMREGWKCTFDLLINAPEYLPPAVMNHLLNQAGRLVGLLDFRPTYGRFTVTRFEVREA